MPNIVSFCLISVHVGFEIDLQTIIIWRTRSTLSLANHLNQREPASHTKLRIFRIKGWEKDLFPIRILHGNDYSLGWKYYIFFLRFFSPSLLNGLYIDAEYCILLFNKCARWIWNWFVDDIICRTRSTLSLAISQSKRTSLHTKKPKYW